MSTTPTTVIDCDYIEGTVFRFVAQGREGGSEEDPSPSAVRSAILHTCGDVDALLLLKHLLETRWGGVLTTVWNGHPQNSVPCFVLLVSCFVLSTFDGLGRYHLTPSQLVVHSVLLCDDFFLWIKIGGGGSESLSNRVRMFAFSIEYPFRLILFYDEIVMNVVLFSLWKTGFLWAHPHFWGFEWGCCRSREMLEASGTEEADAQLIQTHRGLVGEGGGGTRWGFLSWVSFDSTRLK